jgi:purine nucleosidase
MNAQPIIIDCDPGQDDAIALLMAFASHEELNILGVTTVHGNVELHWTQRNARLICDLAGADDIRVFAGCSRPMIVAPRTGSDSHGNTGLDGVDWPEVRHPLERDHAVDFMVDTLLAAEDNSVIVVALGPLTNVAMAIIKDPRILPKIKELNIMGAWRLGAPKPTPAADFNTLIDPHAAHVVYSCGRPIVLVNMDATAQALTTQPRMAAIAGIGPRVGKRAHDLIAFYDGRRANKYKEGAPGGALHDPCNIAYLLKPSLFRTRHVNVVVEIHSELTMGMTVVDFWHITGRSPNAHYIHAVDSDGFFDLLTERLARIERRVG